MAIQTLTLSPVVFESGEALHEIYPRLLETVIGQGIKVSPRGELTYEISPLVFSLENPRDCVRLQRCRRLNYAYAIVEKLSLLRGVADADMLCYYIPKLRSLLNEEGVFEGAYAPRVSTQLQYVYEELIADPDSRRAVITIFTAHLDHHQSLDVPCTVSLQFLLREGHLSLIANMRSSDVYLGLPYDVQQFTFLQQLLAHWLGVEMGPYVHVAGSAHVYERDLPAAKEVIEQYDELNTLTEPPVDLDHNSALLQVESFFEVEGQLRRQKRMVQSQPPGLALRSDYLGICLKRIEQFIRRRSRANLAVKQQVGA